MWSCLQQNYLYNLVKRSIRPKAKGHNVFLYMTVRHVDVIIDLYFIFECINLLEKPLQIARKKRSLWFMRI
jgi:hypothetical protein